MKKRISLLAALLAVTLLLSGCSTLVLLAGTAATQEQEKQVVATYTPAPTAAPTAEPTATPEPTPEPTPTPTPEPTPVPTPESTPDPIAYVVGPTWISYVHQADGSWAMYELTFGTDGTLTYLAGLYASDLVYLDTGTWTYGSEPNTFRYEILIDGMQLSGEAHAAVANGENLCITHRTGAQLNPYVAEQYGLEFVLKGSSMDQPPF